MRGAAAHRGGGPVALEVGAAAEITKIVEDAMKSIGLKAVIVKVTAGDEVNIRKAWGESMTDVPATPKMHFRNGSVSVAYISNLLLQYVDDKKVTLDDTIDEWYPELPNADAVTLKMLANQTSGYPDYETDQNFLDAFNADPFHIFTTQERLDLAFSRPPLFPPGTNWAYAHTNFMILGEILQTIGGKPLAELLRDEVLEPMGLHDTEVAVTSGIPTPTLHTYSAERTGLYEEATYWSTQWAPPVGANETTTIDDLSTTAVALGTGTLLSGLGVVEAYLPSEKIGIALATTLDPGAFTPEGAYKNAASALFKQIGAIMTPDDAPPERPTT